MEDTESFMTLEGEDGTQTEFAVLDTLDYQGDSYLVLVPSEDDGNGDDEPEDADDGSKIASKYDDADEDDEEPVEVVILKVVPGADGDDEYETIEDGDVLEQLFETFQQRHADEYEFE